MSVRSEECGVEWVGIRELANRTSGIIERMTSTGRPALITKHGRPVAVLMPVDEESLEDWVLAHAPAFVRSMAEADKDLAAGRTRAALEVLDELDAETTAATTPSG